LVDNIPGGLIIFDFDGELVKNKFVSDGVLRMTGYTAEEFKESSQSRMGFGGISTDDIEPIKNELKLALLENRPAEYTCHTVNKDGGSSWVEFRASKLYEKDGIVGFLSLFLDTTRQNDAEQKLQIQTARAHILEELCNDTLLQYAPKDDYLQYSYKSVDGSLRKREEKDFLAKRKFEKFLHPDCCDVYVTALAAACANSGTLTFEHKCRIGTGAYKWYRTTFRSITDGRGSVISVLGRMENIDKIVKERDSALERASVDTLTGVLGRAALIEAIDKRIRVNKGSSALLMLDIDNFKAINDTYGHSVGDQAIIMTAQLLQRVFSAGDIVGRYGGDEFLVYMENVSKSAVVKRLDEFRALLTAAGEKQDYTISCSIGVAFAREDCDSWTKLFEKADNLMYCVKQKGKNGYHIKG